MIYVYLNKERHPFLMYYLKKDKSKTLLFYKITSIENMQWWKSNSDKYLKNFIIKNYD